MKILIINRKKTQVPNELITTKEQSTDNQFLQIEPLIRTIRGQQVLLDSDLAILYGVETKRLNQQVKRNIERFPEYFMFQLTQEEVICSRSQIATLNKGTNLRSQIATSSQEVSLKSQIVTSSHGGVRYLPYAFTENGIAMLSSVLRSPIAIQVNIRIMRAFTAMRQFIASNAQIFQRLDVMEQNQLALTAHQVETDHKLEEVFRRLDSGMCNPTKASSTTDKYSMPTPSSTTAYAKPPRASSSSTTTSTIVSSPYYPNEQTR